MIEIRTAADMGVGLGELVALAVRCQVERSRHIAYVGVDHQTVAAEVAEVDDWLHCTQVASAAGRMVGWLLAEVDPDMGRVWWWGPFVDAPEWAPVADALMRAGRSQLDPAVHEEEMAADEAHVDLAATARAFGLRAEVASTVLSAPLAALNIVDGGRLAVTGDAPDIERLHAATFPTGHLLPKVAGSVGADDRIRTVAGHDDEVAAYAIAEVQPGGEGYIDFLGTEPSARRAGFGRAAISAACRELTARGCSRVHLTVRADNKAARGLYASLGFTEERNLVPYRKGFSIVG